MFSEATGSDLGIPLNIPELRKQFIFDAYFVKRKISVGLYPEWSVVRGVEQDKQTGD